MLVKLIDRYLGRLIDLNKLILLFFLLVSCVSVVPLLCHFVAECGHDEGGIIVGREVSLMESFSVLNVILVADPISVLKAMEKGEHHDVFSKGCLENFIGTYSFERDFSEISK